MLYPCPDCNFIAQSERALHLHQSHIHKSFDYHGTTGGYSNRKCRCARCRKAWSEYCLELRERRKKHVLPTLPESRHGDASTYFNYGCRCRKCKNAHNARNRERKERRQV